MKPMTSPDSAGPKRVVVAFPTVLDPGEWEQVLSIRRRFDPLAAAIPPHLTLVFPFEDALPDRALEDHVRRAVSDKPRFPMVLREITAHEGEYLFLNVKSGSDALIGLHDRLYTGPLAGHNLRTNTFVPHVTVGRVPANDLPAALAATAGFTSAIRVAVDTITAYRIDAGGNRTVLFDVPLAPAPV
jgi:2'-5' RNA ligase